MSRGSIAGLRRASLSAISAAALACAACSSAPPPAPPPKPVAAPAPKPAPPPPAPLKPKPIPVRPRAVAPRPSIAAADGVAFDGTMFTLDSVTTVNARMQREYYAPGDTAQKWSRRVELQAYAAQPGVGPMEFAADVGKQLKAANPYARYSLREYRDGSVVLDYFVSDAAALEQHYLELDVYRIGTDTLSRDIVSFHFTEHIYVNPQASAVDTRAQAKATREKVLAEILKAPLYRE